MPLPSFLVSTDKPHKPKTLKRLLIAGGGLLGLSLFINTPYLQIQTIDLLSANSGNGKTHTLTSPHSVKIEYREDNKLWKTPSLSLNFANETATSTDGDSKQSASIPLNLVNQDEVQEAGDHGCHIAKSILSRDSDTFTHSIDMLGSLDKAKNRASIFTKNYC